MSAALFAWMALYIVKNRYICLRILVDKHLPNKKSNDD